ncbi:hypothetical protein AB1N83_007009 [Pleurotus pulmonarius]
MNVATSQRVGHVSCNENYPRVPQPQRPAPTPISTDAAPLTLKFVASPCAAAFVPLPADAPEVPGREEAAGEETAMPNADVEGAERIVPLPEADIDRQEKANDGIWKSVPSVAQLLVWSWLAWQTDPWQERRKAVSRGQGKTAPINSYS